MPDNKFFNGCGFATQSYRSASCRPNGSFHTIVVWLTNRAAEHGQPK